MYRIFIILIINYSQIVFIKSRPLCNKETISPPFSEFHCSGLKIDSSTHENDKYCCYWSFVDNSTNKETKRCSSINENQFEKLKEYIYNKTKKYQDLDIKCVKNQEIFCSNVVLDEEQIGECKKLPISNSKDKYCCRWKFEDSYNYNKKNDYCASINKFEYLNIKQYIKYKNDDPEQRYDNLKIDCKSKNISEENLGLIIYFIFLLFI